MRGYQSVSYIFSVGWGLVEIIEKVILEFSGKTGHRRSIPGRSSILRYNVAFRHCLGIAMGAIPR